MKIQIKTYSFLSTCSLSNFLATAHMRPTAAKTYKSYAFTLRPRDGCVLRHDNKTVAWLRRYCDYYACHAEGVDEGRHLHCGLYLKKAVTRSNIALMLVRAFRDVLEDDEIRVLKGGIRIMYNRDFIDNYMTKEEYEEVAVNMPEAACLDGYYPPSEEQEMAKALKAVDKYYAKLEAYWFQYQPPATEMTYHNVAAFLSRLMNELRLIRVIADDRKLKTTARALKRYMTKEHYVVTLDPWES